MKTLFNYFILISLSSCSLQDKPINLNHKLNLYQPATLRLKAQAPIQTIDGIYTPQTDEVWQSDARFRKLERETYHNN